MATSKKATAKKPTKLQPAKSSCEDYMRLRQILDSLEIGALRYYLDDTTKRQKKERLEELETELIPIINKLWGGSPDSLVNCPKGYRTCDGVCVPYSCFPR